MRDKRTDLVRYSSLIYEKGWVANHEGNLSVRQGERFLCTPTSFSKGDVAERDLIEVDKDGSLLRGFRRPFSEFKLHATIFDERSDVNAVLHAHPPFATAKSCVGEGLAAPLIAESVVSIGPDVPLVPFTIPKSKTWVSSLIPFLVRYDALILENHGVFTFGVDLEQAFLRMEYVEHLCNIESKARQIGSPRYLSWSEIQPLLDSRKNAGLGPEARGMSRDEAYGHLR